MPRWTRHGIKIGGWDGTSPTRVMPRRALRTQVHIIVAIGLKYARRWYIGIKAQEFPNPPFRLFFWCRVFL